MPFKSRSQQRWMHAANARGQINETTVKRWDDATKKQEGGFEALPEKVKKKGHTKKAFFLGFEKKAESSIYSFDPVDEPETPFNKKRRESNYEVGALE